jgi:hypothetical protein
MIGIGMVILQSNMDLLKVEPDLCDDNEVIDVKVEEVTIKEEDFTVVKEEDFTVVKEEEDPLLIRVPLTGAEHEVSYVLQMSRNAMSVLLSAQEVILYCSQDIAGRPACNVCRHLHFAWQLLCLMVVYYSHSCMISSFWEQNVIS